jgi:hypothetical protein
MRRVEAILAAVLALSLTGCVLRGKPTTADVTPVPPKPVSLPTPEPAPGPFSVPQTQVELPPPQPLSNEARASTEPPEETPSTPVVRTTKPPKPRPSGTAAATVRTEPVAAAPPAAPPPAVETERPPIQEILTAAEATRLLNEAVKSRQEINRVVEQLKQHHLSGVEAETREQAVSLSKLSEQAQKSGDMRKASELAVKGLVLAKALLDGK